MYPGLRLPGKYDGEGGGGWESKNLGISFLEAVYGVRVSFLSLCIFFLCVDFKAMGVSGAVCAFY